MSKPPASRSGPQSRASGVEDGHSGLPVTLGLRPAVGDELVDQAGFPVAEVGVDLGRELSPGHHGHAAVVFDNDQPVAGPEILGLADRLGNDHSPPVAHRPDGAGTPDGSAPTWCPGWDSPRPGGRG